MENVIYYPQNIGKKKHNYFFSFLSFSAIFVVNLIVDLFFDNLRVQYRVNLSTSLLILLFIIIFNYVSDNLNRFLLFFWYIFYLCGTLFLNSVAVFDPKITIPNENADNLYFVCLISLTLGIIISENMYRRSHYVNISLVNSIPSGFTFIFFVFPFLFLLSTYSRIGFIPILTGGSIIEDMYNYDYGPLYSYKYLINVSILIAIYYAMSRPKKWIYISLAIIFALITLIDGKRAVLLSSIISGGVLYWLYSTKFYKVNYKLIIILLSGAFIMYSALSSLRAGKSNEITGIQSVIEKFPVGVEYTDYVYSFETFEVGQLKNYSFFKSSIGSFLNSSLLTALGLDKKELVETGSAYAWMREYGIDLGIRTGIISELYFDYGIISIFLMFIMGFILDWIVRSIYKTKDVINLMLLISIFGMNVLLIVGQATVYFGTLTLVLYVYIFYKTFKLFAK